jgi:type II secretory pathway component GspD/PulD (secretin)
VPWSTVLEHLAKITGLQVVSPVRPTGVCLIPAKSPNGKDKTYTVAEIIDMLNESLAPQKLILVRGTAKIGVYPADEEVDHSLLKTVTLQELYGPGLGKTEVVRLVYQLTQLDAKSTALTAKKLLGSFGQAIPIEEANQLILIDTVANLRGVIATIKELQDQGAKQLQSWTHKCVWCDATWAAWELRESLGAWRRPSQAEATRITVTADERAKTIVVYGSPEKIALAGTVINKVDVVSRPKPVDTPVLKTYPVRAGKAGAVARQLQEIYEGTSIRITAVGNASIMVYGPVDMQREIAFLLPTPSELRRR